MAGRAFAFADPKIIELAKTKFIPVCCDDWYQRRRQDDEGEFFRKVADQGPRKGKDGSTRQGIYTFTADGSLLEYKNAGQDVAATREQLDRALKKWNVLPIAKTKPGALTIPDPEKLDKNYSRTPPKDGLIVKVNARILDLKDGEYVRGKCENAGGMKASRDFLWLTAEDVKALTPEKMEIDFSYPLPAAVARRIARFHLLDNTRGEPVFWKKDEVTLSKVTLTVAEVKDDSFTLKVSGSVLLQGRDRGFWPTFVGTICYNRKKKIFDRFDIVAYGEHWGDDSFTGSGSRPGKTPFGVAFTLANPDIPAERVSPQAARDLNLYIRGD